MARQFYLKQYSLALAHSLVLLDPEIEPYQVLSIRARMNLGAMAIKIELNIPQNPSITGVTIGLFSVISRHRLGESYSSADKQSMQSTTPIDWAIFGKTDFEIK